MISIRRGSARVHAHDDGSGIALIGLFVVLALIVGGIRLTAQEVTGASRGAVRPFAGAFIPTGDQRDALEDAVLTGAQVSWTVHPNVGLLASFGWTPSTDKITPGDQTLDAFQYDVVVEARAAQLSTARLTPFLGLGAGWRTYSYRDLEVGTPASPEMRARKCSETKFWIGKLVASDLPTPRALDRAAGCRR